jgi:hypothetical protein
VKLTDVLSINHRTISVSYRPPLNFLKNIILDRSGNARRGVIPVIAGEKVALQHPFHILVYTLVDQCEY